MDKQKEQLFEGATRKLIRQLDTMNLTQRSRMQAKNFVLLFRDSFKSEDVKKATFSRVIGQDYKLFPYDSYGFCKAASCSFVALMNNPQEWRVMYIDEMWTYGPHYYVQHIKTGQAFDLTYDQYAYDRLSVPYDMGRPVKINREAQDTVVRFLHSVGLDYVNFFKKNNAKE
ncbi:MAG: hypothetical protein J6K82_03055 [Alphaproteobacteria bacterium]|nr:hypothetical protein [Alphaproteobacteria bacterium]